MSPHFQLYILVTFQRYLYLIEFCCIVFFFLVDFIFSGQNYLVGFKPRSTLETNKAKTPFVGYPALKLNYVGHKNMALVAWMGREGKLSSRKGLELIQLLAITISAYMSVRDADLNLRCQRIIQETLSLYIRGPQSSVKVNDECISSFEE